MNTYNVYELMQQNIEWKVITHESFWVRKPVETFEF